MIVGIGKKAFHLQPALNYSADSARGVSCWRSSSTDMAILPPPAPERRYPLDPWCPTHVGGHDAASGTGQGQEEERRGAQEASSTHQRVGPRVEAAKTSADLHTQAHTQNSSQACDESKDETRVKSKDETPSLAYSAVGAWELLPLLQHPDPVRTAHPNCPQTQTHPT